MFLAAPDENSGRVVRETDGGGEAVTVAGIGDGDIAARVRHFTGRLGEIAEGGGKADGLKAQGTRRYT